MNEIPNKRLWEHLQYFLIALEEKGCPICGRKNCHVDNCEMRDLLAELEKALYTEQDWRDAIG